MRGIKLGTRLGLLLLGALIPVTATVLADDAVYAGRVLDAKGKGVSGVPVAIRVKAWPGGSFQIRDHQLESGRKGRFDASEHVTAGSRFGVWSAVAEPGRTLSTRYDWSQDGSPVEGIELVTAKADPLHLRFVDDDGKPVEDVEVYGVVRAESDGTRHELGPSAPEATIQRSGKNGKATVEQFLAGEWVAVQVRFPGGDWQRRYLSVPEDSKQVVDIPRPAPVTPDIELTAGDDPDKRFFLMGPKAGDTQPEAGYGLILVLPGGPGDDSFRGWVRERYDDWVDRGYVFAQLVSKHWQPNPPIIWPTEASPLDGMKFGTEEFVEDVVADVAERVELDRSRIFTVSWSSSGPACYHIASRKKTSVTGSLIAMSIYRRDLLESTRHLKQRPFFLLHSPTDAKCPLRMAEDGRDALLKYKAVVEWSTYEGGHGWAGDSIEQARHALRWLAEQQE